MIDVSGGSRATGGSRTPLHVAMLQMRPPKDGDDAIDRIADMASDAKRGGASLVACGETALPGYPAWIDHCPGAMLWDHEATKEAYAAYREASVRVSPADERMQRLCAVARDLSVVMVIGLSERVDAGPGSRTLYNSLVTIDADGRIVNHHRKLVPTFTERVIWGPSDTGAGLRAVDTASGRVGSLVCWEHWMPLPRQALHDSGELVHVAVWPTVHDKHQLASRHYALEGRCFVLAVGQIVHVDDLPAGLPARDDSPELVLRGGSCIVGPDGAFIVEPVFDEERVIHAELDPSAVDREAMTLDVSGHYARPDIFRFGVRARPGPGGGRRTDRGRRGEA